MAQIHSQSLLIPSAFGNSMAADLTYPLGAKKLVVYAHGINGFKDWGGMGEIAMQFAKDGIAFLKFNFSHNGTQPNEPEEFVDLEAYGNDNYSIRQSDLKQVVTFILSGALPVEAEELYLIGHSRGGIDALIYVTSHDHFDGLITWAAPDNAQTPWHAWSSNKLELWKKEGVVFLKNGRTGQNLPLYYQLHEDYLINQERYDVQTLCSKVGIPWLIIHGTSDEAVDVDQGKRLKKLHPKAELHLIKETGHPFGRSHPWQEVELPKPTQELIQASLSFINQV